MKPWKIWFFGSIALVIFAGTALFSALWNDLSTGWTTESTAAQYALNHTALQTLSSYTVYSGPGGVEDVFVGQDAFHRNGIALVELNPRHADYVQEKDVIPKHEAMSLARRYFRNPVNAALGALNPRAKLTLHTTSTYVWEVTYRTGQQYGYLYLDAKTGRLVWK